MTATVTAGTKFYIGSQKPCVAVADYDGDTYIEVTGIKDLGEVADEAEAIKRGGSENLHRSAEWSFCLTAARMVAAQERR